MYSIVGYSFNFLTVFELSDLHDADFLLYPSPGGNSSFFGEGEQLTGEEHICPVHVRKAATVFLQLGNQVMIFGFYAVVPFTDLKAVIVV